MLEEDQATSPERARPGGSGAQQQIVTLLETLNGEHAKRHFALIYVAIVLGTCVTFFDYTNMWECQNICKDTDQCNVASVGCMSPAEDTAAAGGKTEEDGLSTLPDGGSLMNTSMLEQGAVIWTGDVSHLHWLNRFMHVTLRIAPAAQWGGASFQQDREVVSSLRGFNVSEISPTMVPGSKYAEIYKESVEKLGYGVVMLTQTVFTESEDDGVAISHTEVVDFTRCRLLKECASPPLRVMASGHERKKLVIRVQQMTHLTQLDQAYARYFDGDALNDTVPFGQYLAEHASLSLEYQTGIYTAVDLCVRMALLATTIYVYIWYHRRFEAVGATSDSAPQEQAWMPSLLLALGLYLNPVAFLGTVLSFNTSATLLENVLEFLEFHAATLFTILIQYMYIVLISGMRETQSLISGEAQPSTPVSCWARLGYRRFWQGWVLLMVVCDLLVALIYKGPSSDYTATYVGWVLNTKLQHLSPFLGALYIFGLLLTFLWVFWSIVETQRVKHWLKKVPYGPSRRKQLAFRSLVFMVWTYAVSRLICQILYWGFLGRYRMVYKSADETGTVLLCSVFTFSIVYQFAPAPPRTDDMPPLPGDPSWEHPRWRRCVWPDSWYTWLVEHGGTLFYFIEEQEQEEFDALQRTETLPLILINCASEAGWPARVSPCHSADIFRHIPPHTEIRAIPLLGAGAPAAEFSPNSTTSSLSAAQTTRDGWYHLPDGTFISTTDPGCQGKWVAPEHIGFGVDIGAQLRESRRRQATTRGVGDMMAAGVDSLLHGRWGDMGSMGEESRRLFFCVETASICADLSYAVYYEPGEADFRNAIQSPNSFGWTLTTQCCAYFSISLAGAVAAIATGLTRAAPPLLFFDVLEGSAGSAGETTHGMGTSGSGGSSSSVGGSRANSPPTPQGASAAAAAAAQRALPADLPGGVLGIPRIALPNPVGAGGQGGRGSRQGDLPVPPALSLGSGGMRRAGSAALLPSPMSTPPVSPGDPSGPQGFGGRVKVPLSATAAGEKHRRDLQKKALERERDKNAERTDLLAIGVTLFDVIDLAGTRVFISIDSQRNRVYITFRGSDNRFSRFNLMSDLRFTRKVWGVMGEAANWGTQKLLFGCCTQPLLHRGFMEMWEKVGGGHNLRGPLQSLPLRDVVLHAVDRVLQRFPEAKPPQFFCTGHSLGGALACLCAYSLRKRRRIEAVVYTFGVPKLGNRAFKRAYDLEVPNTFSLVHEYDPVVHISGTLCNYHIGHEVCIDRRGTLLVEPTWVEKTFQPTKGVVMSDLGGHGLDSYNQALNRVFLRSGSDKKCFYPKQKEGVSQQDPEAAQHDTLDTEVPSGEGDPTLAAKQAVLQRMGSDEEDLIQELAELTQFSDTDGLL